MTRAELLAVECPRCHAADGVACVMLSGKNTGKPLLTRYHHSRFHGERRSLANRRLLAAEAKQEQLDDKHPEHAKLRRVEPESQKLGEFLEWLQQKYTVCVMVGAEYAPARTSEETILARYFGIDLKKLEAEKRSMLADLRHKLPYTKP